jgi:hypothetical protein
MHLLDQLIEFGGFGEALDVGDGQTDEQVHEDDGDQHREQEQEEMRRQRERLTLYILN